jgi:TonB-dependent SusC/RagA subfamily outer membrane receptor
MGTRARSSKRFSALVGGTLALTTLGCSSATTEAPAGPAPEDVVMNGYGTVARTSVTGAVTSLIESDETDLRYHTMAELLMGRVPGLEVMRGPAGPTLRIRGVSSFSLNQEPLIVVDGVAVSEPGFSSPLWAINPRDVLRVDVLKDGASAALYGVRGGNGVIVITTRHGR